MKTKSIEQSNFELKLLELIDRNDYFNDRMCPSRIFQDMRREYPTVTWRKIHSIMTEWHSDNSIHLRDGYWYVNWEIMGKSAENI